MKSRVFAAASVVAFAFGVFAAQNDALLSFSTSGPDTYADGTTVLDGETYALVWAPTGSEGVTFAADGTVEGGKIVLAAPVAKGGRCPKVVFEVEASRMESEFAGGTWAVYLLDTRRWGDSGAAAPSGYKGEGAAVNAVGAVYDSAVTVAAGTTASAVVSGAAVASVETVVPADAPSPKITAMKVEGGYVYITVKNTVPYLAYDLKSGATPGAVNESANAPKSGEVGGDIILVAPAKEGSGFFRVGRK